MSAMAEKQCLLIVGASGRSAAQRASLLGMEVIAIDQFGDRDLQAIAQVHSLHSVLDNHESTWQSWCEAHLTLPPFNRCQPPMLLPLSKRYQVPLLLCGGVENRADVIGWFTRSGLACGMKPEMLAALRSPEAWRRWAMTSGLMWPETLFHVPATVPASPQVLGISNLEPSGAWLIKSRSGAGGLGVRKFAGEPPQASEYLQRSIAGEVLGVTFVNVEDRSHIAGCMKSWTEDAFWGPMPFIYRGSVGPIPLSVDEQEILLNFANIVRAATGLQGIWQADFVRNQKGWWLLEINPRWSGSMELLEVAYGISLVAQHVAAVSGRRHSAMSTIDWNEHSMRCRAPIGCTIGKVVRYARSELTPDHAMLERWWSARWDGTAASLVDGNRLADIPGEATTIPFGYPVCTEYAVGGSIEEVTDRLQRSVISMTLAT